ncbi:hypothetical protein HOF56_00455 [Candidatus Peribacteria bacterium]|nr:hypothetical protein [Candidatus Peribacteria bacterium]MBT4021744.1 hypothetical protein [Candidatus Peribacteria bacterium]MBT4240875.1 hypothetical protein [Candidatus Peribacteria bacterium]MBT4474660.1 hypothetical protein [Candidatus Peribacteria bacterium]
MKTKITLLTLASLVLSFVPFQTVACGCSGEREFLVTAYYSPLPDQEHYYLGSYQSDVAFNGSGLKAKDGTPVYPGMMAAPPEFPFGTKIEIPRLGVVGMVHDRGGRIVTGEDGIARIDIWLGHGEEGLARALEWGARKVTARVYYPQPEFIPDVNLDFSKFPAPDSALARLPSNPVAMKDIPDPRYEDTSSQVAAIQYSLRNLEYFDHDITSFYGDVTKESLSNFLRDTGRDVLGEIADSEARDVLIAHSNIAKELESPLPPEEVIVQGSSGKEVRVLQRILKLLGLYEGEIDGIYDQGIMQIVYNFQRDKGIVSSLADTGAGIVGPQTHRALLTAWREHRIDRRGGTELVAAL